jgi:hypothetical protein
MFLTFLRKIGVGALYGAGFTAASIVTLLAFMGGLGTFFPERTTWSSSSTAGPTEPKNLNGQLKIQTGPAKPNNFGTLALVGSVENTGPALTGYINVLADLFDANGQFIYQCMHQIQGGIASGAKEYFVIDCHSMNKELNALYATHKLHAKALR